MAVMGMVARGDRRDSLNRQELRLALAMRGGVSLCVWIGGAVAEIEQLRRFEEDSPYSGLARLAGYTGVKVDVLAGASAGGLNGVIYGAAQAYGFDFSAMRDLWIRLADIADLSRSPFSSIDQNLPGPPRYGKRPPSLLRGDAYFLDRLQRELTALCASGQPDRSVDHLDVILSATRWSPEPVRSYDNRFAAIEETRSAAYFHFRHRPDRSDFGPDAIPLLAGAARATSSFPAAFEPARLHFDGPGSFTGVFSPPPAGTHDLFAIDGGVLDNIPVTAAVDAIAAAPASGATDRWLLYLHPSPGRPAAGPAPGPGSGTENENGNGNGNSDTVDRRPRAAKVVGRFLSARLGQESLLTDIDELDALNAELAAQRLRRQGLLAPLSAAAATAAARNRDPTAAVVRAVLSQWQGQRSALIPVKAQLDARWLNEVLERPDAALLGTGAPRFGRPAEGWGPLRSLLGPTLAAVLQLDYEHRPETAFADADSLLAAADVVLGLTHWLQRYLPSNSADLAHAKAEAYDVRTAAETQRTAAARIWPAAARQLPEDGPAGPDRAHTLTTWALHTLDSWRAAMSLPEQWDRLVSAVNGLRDALGSVEQVMSTARAAAGWNADRAQQARVAEAAAQVGGYEEALALTESHGGIDAAHRAVLGARPNQTEAVLQALAGLLTPLRASPVAPTPAISFLRLAGSNPCPIGDLLPGLFDGVDHTGPLDPGRKLCGDELGNFAAFLSARWRANDWMWGRLDAVVSLVDLLVDPRRLYVFATAGIDRGDPAAAEAAAAGLVGELAMLAASPVNDSPAEAIRAEIGALFARPNDLHLLSETRRLLARRLQWEVLEAELPAVMAEREDPPAPDAPRPTPAPLVGTDDPRLAGYRVGRESVYDLSQDRLATIAMRLALVAMRVIKPSGRAGGNRTGTPRLLAIAGRGALLGGLSLVKPVYLGAAFVAAAPRRGRLVLAILTAGVAAAMKRRPGGCPPSDGSASGAVALSSVVVWAAVATVTVAMLVWCAVSLRQEWRRHAAAVSQPLARLLHAPVRREAIATGVLVAGLAASLASRPCAEWQRTALVAAAASLLIWAGGFWMRPAARWVLAAVGATPYLVGAALRSHQTDRGDVLRSQGRDLAATGRDALDLVDAVAKRGWPIVLALAAVVAAQVLLRWATDPGETKPVPRLLSPRWGAALTIAGLWLLAFWMVRPETVAAPLSAAAATRMPSMGVSGWALLALLVAGSAQTLMITFWNVLPDRPGDRRGTRQPAPATPTAATSPPGADLGEAAGAPAPRMHESAMPV